MTRIDSMKTKTDQELITLLTKTRTAMRLERFSAAGARAKNPNQLSQLRKKVARIFTEQRFRIKATK